MPRVFAYCRVSTVDQTPENQVLEIQAAGFQLEPRRVITEKVSGSTPAMERQGFRKLIDRLDWDDVLIVTKLDRLGRNAMDVRATLERLHSLRSSRSLARHGKMMRSGKSWRSGTGAGSLANFTGPPSRAASRSIFGTFRHGSAAEQNRRLFSAPALKRSDFAPCDRVYPPLTRASTPCL